MSALTEVSIATCKHSGIKFAGRCSVVECPANVRQRHPSGCIYAMLRKEQVDLYDLAYVLGKTSAEIEDRYQDELSRLESIVKIVEHLGGYAPAAHQCAQCGVTRSTPGDCLNAMKCARRVRLLNKLRGSNEEFYQMFELTAHQTWWLLQQAAKNTELEIALWLNLEADDSLVDKLERIPSIV